MAKFMVVVNAKFMVLVEAQSACSAEHVILDDIYYGIKSAQAFSTEEVYTECFRGFMTCCDTISMRELEEWSQHYHAFEVQKEEAKATIERINKERKALEDQLQALSSQLNTASDNLDYYDRMLRQAV